MNINQEMENRLESAGGTSAAASTAQSPFTTPAHFTAARALARALAVAQNNAALYPATHPHVVQSITEFVEAATMIFDLGLDEVTVNVYKQTLFIENHVLPEESVTYRKLICDLLSRGISALTVARNFSARDAHAVATMLNTTDVTSIAQARALLESFGTTSVLLAETTDLEDTSRAEEDRENKAVNRAAYDHGVTLMRDVETQTKLGHVFEVEPLRQLIGGLIDNLFRDPAAILGLTAIKSHDTYTLNHSLNVCILSLSLGSALGLETEMLKSLGLSALLYDLGKVRIPEEILNKEGPLTAAEWTIVKSHTTEGADLLKRIQLVDQMPMIVAYEHHQRQDLQGYPQPENGREQHLFSKVVALCDAYDAMTTRRPFRREIRPDKALAVLMQGRDKAYDPTVTKTFVAMLGIYPMGAVVVLDDSSTAVVFRINKDDLLRPRVKRIIDASGRWLEEPETIDLRLVNPQTGTYDRNIIECIPAAEAGIDDVWQYL